MLNLNRRAQKLEKATFGMGCFWGPDSQFGQYPGVIRTRTGFSGGTTADPSYRSIGDHTEMLQIEFDSSIISYKEILQLFWDSHDAAKDRGYKGRQYLSLLIVHSLEQLETAEQVKHEWEKQHGKKIETELLFDHPFYPAEEHHQKYHLKRFLKAMASVLPLFSDHTSFADSTIAARLNGFVREYGRLPDIKKELSDWRLSEEEEKIIREMLEQIKW
ncbi:MAG: peptide-methionine (S)-S-oxide reductase MsrA [Alkalibacterium sp.]|nr:peptide-methionine (S)-S-oxide reductase MsrA [Alkalibacterium sp.]